MIIPVVLNMRRSFMYQMRSNFSLKLNRVFDKSADKCVEVDKFY